MNTPRTFASLLLGAAVALTGCASAGPHRDHHASGFRDTAKVIDVTPVYDTVSVLIPEEHCWREPPRRHRHHYRNDSATAPILGAIIGGVVGNQFGEGSGKTAMTVAGSLLGASVAHDAQYSHHGHRPAHGRQVCETVERREYREEVVAYDVTYRYRGRVYETRMDHDPGKHIDVSVDVRPY